MANNSDKGFILTNEVYKSPNEDALLGPEKWKPERGVTIELEETTVMKQEQTDINQDAMRKIYANGIYTKLSHPE